MTVRDWVGNTTKFYQNNKPREATKLAARNTWHSLLSRVDERIGGRNIYEDDWDLLIIIDACRADIFRETATEFDYLSNRIETQRSVAPATRNWMQRTFTSDWKEEMNTTEYVVSNPYSGLLLNPNDFGYLDEIHRYAWDDEIGTVEPRPVTERAIDIHRSRDPNRLLVHYMQPHFPSIPDHLGFSLPTGDDFAASYQGNDGGWNSVWDAAQAGEISSERVWRSYKENLRYVLNDVEILLNNVDAETAYISSDHGNAFGEWWTWGHPPSTYVPVNRNVPFTRVDAVDNRTLDPTQQRDSVRGSSEPDDSVAERLENLGYT